MMYRRLAVDVVYIVLNPTKMAPTIKETNVNESPPNDRLLFKKKPVISMFVDCMYMGFIPILYLPTKYP